LEQVKRTAKGIDSTTSELNRKTSELAQKQDEILRKLAEMNTTKASDMVNIKHGTHSNHSGPFSHYDSQDDLKMPIVAPGAQSRTTSYGETIGDFSRNIRSVNKTPVRHVLRATGDQMMKPAAI
jgi:hypothetical protein